MFNKLIQMERLEFAGPRDCIAIWHLQWQKISFTTEIKDQAEYNNRWKRLFKSSRWHFVESSRSLF